MARRRKTKPVDSSEGFLTSVMFRIGSKLLLGLVVVVIFLTLVQCTIKKPESPTWNTTLTVPVVNRTYPMEEIVRKIDQDGIQMDPDSNVIYTVSYDLDTITLDNDNLTAPDISYSFSEVLGPIEIDPPTVAPVMTSIGDIGPLAAAIPGTIPSVDFSIANSMPAISNFSTATVSDGTMYIVVANHLGVNLDVVNVELYDIGNGITVASQSFPSGLLNGATDSIAIVLDGKTISNSLEVRADCHNQPATVLSAASLEMSTSMHFANGLTVTSATAQVPELDAISFSEQQQLGEVGDSDIVYSAHLTGGSVNLAITNNTPLDATLDITLPDLYNGLTPFSVSRSVAANSTTNVNIDVTGYELRPSDHSTPQQINVEAVATIPGSGIQQVAVDQNDNFSVTAGITSLSFDEVSGVFATTDATIDPLTEQIDIPKGFDGINLVSSVLTLEIENDVALPGDLDLLLSDGNGRTLAVTGTVAAGTPDSAVTTTITVVDSSFLSPVPDSVIFTGTATFGDGTTVGTIRSDDYIFARVTLVAPLEMVISETNIDTDIESESIDQEDINLITDHVVEARFVYNVINHLPLGARVRILLGSDTTTLVDQDNQVIPQLTLGEDGDIEVLAAPTIGGIVPADSVSETGYRTIILSNDDVRILENDPLYIGQEITLLGSDGTAVKLTNSDYITINGRIEVEYRFDGDF